MTVRRRVTLIILLVALAPLGLSAYFSLQLHNQAYDTKVTELRVRAAERGASITDAIVDAHRRALEGLLRSIDWQALSAEERVGAVWMLFLQADDIASVGLFDEDGVRVGESAHRMDAHDNMIAGHPLLSASSLVSLSGSLPMARARARGSATGPPQILPGNPLPLVPMAFATRVKDGDSSWVVGVSLSLDGVCAQLREGHPVGTSIALVDAKGVILCASDARTGQPVGAELQALLGTTLTAEYRNSSGVETRMAQAKTDLGWHVIVREPSSLATAPARRIAVQMLFWMGIGLLGAVAAGLILAKSINQPIALLAKGAKALATGNLEHRIPLQSHDEFGALSKAFNLMADEIAEWNRELQQRVTQQTQDLEQAQQQLLDSQKQAAVATLGAGIAHEINSPLTGVLSMIQISRNKVVQLEGHEAIEAMLEKAEEQAKRIGEIVQRMNSLAQEHTGPTQMFSVGEIVEKSIASLMDEFTRADVIVKNTVPVDVAMVHGHASKIQEVVTELMRNAIRAMKHEPKRALTVHAELSGNDLVALEIHDTGCGIEEENLKKVFEPFFTTKQDWESQGLGLALARRVVEGDRGSIRLRNNEGGGVSVRVILPLAVRQTHLV